jgi:hypothetical protein
MVAAFVVPESPAVTAKFPPVIAILRLLANILWPGGGWMYVGGCG